MTILKHIHHIHITPKSGLIYTATLPKSTYRFTKGNRKICSDHPRFPVAMFDYWLARWAS